MNTKRLLAAIAAGFVCIFASDFLVHGILLKPDYVATQSLWRPEAEMTSRMGWMLGAQLLCSVAFVTLWAKGFAEKATIRCACLYGLFMGLFAGAGPIIGYVVMPVPPALAAKHFAITLAQAVLLGLVAFAVYKPAASK